MTSGIRRGAVAAVVAAALVSTACSKKEAEPVVTVQVAAAKRTAIARIVTSEAVLYPLNQAAITPKISAPVHAFYVNRGSKVRSGQLLAVLENRDLAAAEMENKGVLQQAQAGYESATAAGIPEGMQKAELELEQTRAAFEAQRKVYESRQDLYRQGALPRKQLDEAGVALTQARAQYEIAGKHQAALQAGGKQRQLRTASGELTAAKGKYGGAASQLSYSEIRSPIDGVVTERPLYPGEMAPAGTPLITVMDLSQVIAKAHIPQEEAALLKAGDAATLEVPGSEAEVSGKVTLVSPALDIDSTTVEIWIQAPNPARALKPGTTVRVSIPTQEEPQAIVVPASAVLTAEEGETSVMVMGSDQRAHQRAVKLGIRNGDLVQIATGLKAGEQVITAGAYGLPDNTRVRVETGAAPPGAAPPIIRTSDWAARSNFSLSFMDLRSLLDRVRRPAALEEQSAHWFARHTASIIFLICTLALVGGYVAFTIPVSVFPTTNFPRIVIGVDNGVMPIDQMLVTVTRPLEEAVNTVPGLQQVRSITSRGSAEIDLFFDWNADMIQTLQLVDAAVSRAQSSLPSTARIESHRLTFASFPILGYSLTSDTVPQTQLWELATYEIKPRLNRLDGIATVIVQGGQEPEFQITPDPAKLLIAKVTVPDLLEAIRRTNLIDSPGLLERNHQLFLALVNGQVRSPAQIADIVVKTTPAGIPVRIGDVARVGPSVMPVYTRVTSNGKPAVLLNINRQPDSNTMTVADEVHAEVARIQQSLPPGIHLEPFYDQSIIVGESVKSVRDAVLMGIILASIIMVLFLRDWGTSIVAGLVIPVTLLITCIVFKLVGEGFNLMTLGGLAAAVGLVIDDAIVVVENIVRHRDLGESGFEAIHSGLREITVPLIGSTITPIVVFLPLISITGVTGTFFRALAITVAVSLCASLALAMTWTPTLSQYLIHAAKKEGVAAGSDARFTGVIRFYERWLRHALHHPGQVALLAAGVTLVSFFSYEMLGTDLLPEMDEGGFVIDYVMPAGSSLQETDRVVTDIERMLRELPEVESTSRRTGMQLGLAAVTEANTGDISVKLKHKRSRDIDDIMAEARDKIAQQEPAISVEFIQTLQDMIGDLTGAPEPIQIKLFSPDAALLRTWAPRVGQAISKVSGVVDVLDGIENTISGPAVTFEIDPMTAARAGFTPEEVSTDAAAILQGEPASTPVVVGDRAYTIRVRYPEVNRASLEAMSNTLLNSASGHTATLGSLARLSELPGQTEIRRENLQRMVAVTARLEGRDMGSGVAAVQKTVADLHLPAGIRVEYGGTYREQQRSFHDLVLVLLLAILCVFLVLLFEFRNFRAPVAILASSLLSTCGVFLALLITRTEFNVCSFMGLIMVVGIVAKNGILLLDAEQQFRAQGLSPEESILEAGRRRLRPIVMTALATVAGMLPLALAWGAGSQMLQPLAIAVIGGILVSMVLSLLVTPAVQFYLTRRVAEAS